MAEIAMAVKSEDGKFPMIYEHADIFEWWSFELSDWQKWSLKYLIDANKDSIKKYI